jgi:hypothetical protein
MIKQNWNVSNEERSRILNLHESATKNLYLSEQTTVVTGTKTENTTFPLTKLGDNFEYGKYDSQLVKSKILNLKPQILEFITKNNSSNKFIVNISAGESKVTNPKGFETPGSLALARANSVKKYFEEIFPEQIKSGVLVVKTPSSVEQIKIGETPYRGAGSGDSNNPEKKEKYSKEQFVDFDIVGEGKKTSIITTTLCTTKPLESAGIYALSDNDFTTKSKWLIGEGQGSITITTDSITVPDIIYVEYNGKTYGDLIFRGYNTEDLRIFIGTSLMAKYGTGQLPPQFGKNTIKPITIDVVKNNLAEMKSWGLSDSFINTFGLKSSLSNPGYMKAFADFDKTGNSRRLLKSLGNNFPWARLNSPIVAPVGQIGPIQKIDKVNEVTIVNISPVGTTQWKVYLKCNSNQ